jgi:hypothetical protein
MLAFIFYLVGGVTATCPQRQSYEQVEAIAERAADGDSEAAQCLASRLKHLDGGLAHDATSALGQYGDRHPIQLLQLAHQGILSRRQLANAVRVLPESLVDDFRGQFSALEARRERFQEIDTSELANERKLALESIQASLDETKPLLSRQ